MRKHPYSIFSIGLCIAALGVLGAFASCFMEEAESTVAISSNLKMDGCITNYVRTSPNFCAPSTTSSVAFTDQTACTTRTLTGLPANATAVLVTQPRAISNNAIGARSNTVNIYKDSGCTQGLNTYNIQYYEHAAVAAGTNIGQGALTLIVKLDAASAFYTLQTNVGGNGQVSIWGGGTYILGYYD